MASQTETLESTTTGIEDRRRERAWRVGLRVCLLTIALAGAGGLGDLVWGTPVLAISDLLLVLGAGASFLTSHRRADMSFVWQPLYLCGWLGTFPLVGLTGGFRSPFLVGYLMLLLLGGVVVQSRFKARIVALFTVANFALWIGLTSVLGLEPMAPASDTVILSQNLFFILGSIAIILSITSTEEQMAAEAYSQRKRLNQSQAELAQSAKMAEIGTLISTTAHELAQPVQVISLSGSFLRRMIKQGSPNPELLATFTENIVEASSRLATLLASLKDLARKDTFNPVTFDLCEGLRSVTKLAELDLRPRMIGLSVDLPDYAAEVVGDSLKIQQVILNLMNNARDSATKAESQPPSVRISLRELGNWYRIEVSNNGPAIPLEIQPKIFQLYFTTKKKGQGTGLGLTICSELVTLHGGRILFSSGENDTTFVVDLPKKINTGLRTQLQTDSRAAPKDAQRRA